MMQAIIFRVVSVKLDSAQYDIHLPKSVDENVWSPRYLIKVSETLVETHNFVKLVTFLTRTEADRVTEEVAKCE